MGWVKDGDGPRGFTGPKGPHGLPGQEAAAGKDGPIATGDAVSFVDLMDESWLYDLLSQAEDDYIGERLDQARATLIFVARVAADNRPPAAAEAAPKPADVVWARAITLLTQLDRGLAYGGQSRTFVVRRNPFRLIAPINQLVALGSIIAQRRDTVATFLDVAQTRHEKLTDTADKARDGRLTAQAQIAALADEWKIANARLAALDTAVGMLEVALEDAQDDFKRAVEKALAPQCTDYFRTIVECVKAVAEVYVGGAALVAASGKALDAAEKGGLGLNNLKVIEKILEPVGGDIDAIAKGYEKIKGLLAPDGRGAMLLVPQADLEHHVKAALDAIDGVTSASVTDRLNFKNAVTDFVDATQARSKTIAAIDQLAVQSMAAAARANDLDIQERTLRDAAQATMRPEDRIIESRLNTVFRSYLRQVRDFVWQAERAADYYMLRPYAPTNDLSAIDIGIVAKAGGDLILVLENHRTNAPGKPESFPGPGDTAFQITLSLSPAQQKRLHAGTLSISLSPDQIPTAYKRARCVFADKVRVIIHGVTTFQGTLTHLGTGRFINSSGAQMEFLVEPRPMRLTQEILPLGGMPASWSDPMPDDLDYLGLSPFSDWLIELAEPEKIRNLNRATSISFEFQGTLGTT